MLQSIKKATQYKIQYRKRKSTGVTRILIHALLTLFSASCVLPFILIIIVSFTDEKTLALNGYSFFPESFSVKAYEYVFRTADQFLNSSVVSLLVTIIGVVTSVLIMAMLAYTLFRKEFKLRKVIALLIFITMIFNGGLVPFYLICVQLLQLKNSMLALILPLTVNSFYVIVLRTFFQTSISDALIDSARIDGASELRTLMQIVLPISLPGLATIGLFMTLAYWNDWFNAMLFIEDAKLVPLQYLLVRIQESLRFIENNSNNTNVIDAAARQNLPNESARMAMVVIITIPVTLAYPYFQKYFIHGLQIGSVKG